ncbi:MAG TPA: acyl-CoA dehydratase activase [Bacillota bacterium]|nr:acyl-CoA dehydratase activase [Bacillota bacterium]
MSLSIGIDIGSTTLKIAGIDSGGNLMPIEIKYLLTSERLHESILSAYEAYIQKHGEPTYLGVTGSGQKLGSLVLGTNCTATEIIAHATGCVFLAKKLNLPLPRTIIEIGGQDSKLIKLQDGIPTFFNMNSVCSAGTGEFLRHTIEENALDFAAFNNYVLNASGAADLEDICTVFARRSFRHAGQNGVPLDQRLKGLAEAIMRNYLRTVARNYGASFKSTLEPPIYFLGGLANSFALAMTLAKLLGQPVIVPPHFQGIGALGMAVIARESAGRVNTEPTNASRSGECSVESAYCTGCTNSCELTVVQRMGSAFYLGGRCEGAGKAGITSSASISIPTVSKRDLPKTRPIPYPKTDHWGIGIDAGSRQVKAALLHGKDVVYLHTETTAPDLYQQAKTILEVLQSKITDPNAQVYLKTTGSGGRFLSRKLSRHEFMYETEILCHFRAANTLFPDVGTVIDIGGNDSKIIIATGSGLDFAMNDRCAAGTGSFLEQLAKRFGLTLEEAAELAMSSAKPARIGSRCAVLAETDIVHKMRSGAETKDLLFGACFSVAKTFISDTMHGKSLTLPVVFQGGAFLNQALLRAFTTLLDLKEGEYHIAEDRRFVVGAGAIGAAIYALEAKPSCKLEVARTSEQYSLAGGHR